ncbi:MAG: hypothetical protein JNJ85_13570 [Candidatus Kapabacteria bacterium]|nr:hypothetical protein [Candidatus Kapabacteria bacterium]
MKPILLVLYTLLTTIMISCCGCPVMDYPRLPAYRYLPKRESASRTDLEVWETTICTEPQVVLSIEPIPQIIPCSEDPDEEYANSIGITLKTPVKDTSWLQKTDIRASVFYSTFDHAFRSYHAVFTVQRVDNIRNRRYDGDVKAKPIYLQGNYFYHMVATCTSPEPYMKINGNKVTDYMRNHQVIITGKINGNDFIRIFRTDEF